MFTTGEAVGLAEGITDNVCLVNFTFVHTSLFVWPAVMQMREHWFSSFLVLNVQK